MRPGPIHIPLTSFIVASQTSCRVANLSGCAWSRIACFAFVDTVFATLSAHCTFEAMVVCPT